jgi:hypothetical protein
MTPDMAASKFRIRWANASATVLPAPVDEVWYRRCSYPPEIVLTFCYRRRRVGDIVPLEVVVSAVHASRVVDTKVADESSGNARLSRGHSTVVNSYVTKL